MVGLASARVVVAGAGALGASIALVLARAGGSVVLADPAAAGANASGVAAGMLAPAFEAGPEQYAILAHARDAWPAFAATLGSDLGFRRSGAVWIDLPGAEPRLGTLARALAAAGVAHQQWDRSALDRAAPGLAGVLHEGLFTPEDWRLEPRAALAALRGAATDAGVELAPQGVAGIARGRVAFADGATTGADALVLATGAAGRHLAPETRLLSPIKGHILQYAETRTDDARPMIRTARGYATPARDGLRVGATMEPGVADSRVDPKAAAPLGQLAVDLYPALDGATFLLQAGVRAATPDEWPLVGPSSEPGVWLAVGARRNGWLLAPLVAHMTAAYLAGGDPGPYAKAFHPSRFAAS
ncbi:MAG TPA: FAD-dependent oxidoreductase [Caulobacteraceae bacterium]|nr:FAD-dependent oxidoreductase [Caulobacteraceae bacterium]